MGENDSQSATIRILCRKLLLPKLDDHRHQPKDTQIQWLIGSSFFPSPTIISTLRCIHTLPSNPNVPDFPKESDDIETLLPKGFEVIGALIVNSDSDFQNSAREAVAAVVSLRKLLYSDVAGGFNEDGSFIGATLNSNNVADIKFYVLKIGDPQTIECVTSVIYEEQPEKYLCERGCLVQCQLLLKLPVYYPSKNSKDAENMYIRATEDVVSNLMDPQTTYIVEANEPSTDEQPIVVRSSDLDQHEKSSITLQESSLNTLACSYLCSKGGNLSSTWMEENADRILVSVFSNTSRSSDKPAAPVAEYYPAEEDTKVLGVVQKLEVLCYAAKDLSLASAIFKLLIPALACQLRSTRNKILPNLLTQHQQVLSEVVSPVNFILVHETKSWDQVWTLIDIYMTTENMHPSESQLRLENASIFFYSFHLMTMCAEFLLGLSQSCWETTYLSSQKQTLKYPVNLLLFFWVTSNFFFVQLQPYHFVPPGFLHPVTVIYELSYGEMEMKQVDVRKSLHIRLGLPLNRPLLRIVNAINLFMKDNSKGKSVRKGTSLLKDVHLGIPSSGVSGGTISLIQGSYEYYHYLQDGFDDSGWGCAYRSLQTIVSWFRLQHYGAIDVPSHREIQHALVEIGDKDPSFIGSREWIGAIELSFVLDKLLGVSCKVINVRSGAEFPEKCRELALHFDTQGTPVMIGGGVLAYTLLGVDYNEVSGDCAFLILDPHYTGTDDLKKIVNGGWCGWKKAVDNKGKHFFLHDKFYNLLLPQRPNMV